MDKIYLYHCSRSRRVKQAYKYLYAVFAFLFLFAGTSYAQSKKITGIVKDDNGAPLIGVSIKLKGTNIGTTSNANGFYSINVSGNDAVLVFSYLSYVSQERQVGGATEINIVLVQQVNSLNDVVVVGYGTQKKVDLTGAVSVVDKKLLENRPVTNAVDALQGTAPGLVVTRTDGQPGQEGWTLNVRGFSSLNGLNQPLVIIDGVEGNLITLNPSDIESISVLKDAAAAAIYGAKSSGGVIIVTTKKGHDERVKVTYSGLYTIKKPYSVPKRVPAWQDAELRNIANENAGQGDAFSPQVIGWLKGNDSNFVYNNPNPALNGFYYSVDPISAVLRTASPSQTQNISIEGGEKKTQYLFSLGYYDEDGVFKMGPDGYKRLNGRLNLDTKFDDIFSLDSRISFEQANTASSSAAVNGDYGLLYNIYQLRAYYPTTFPGYPSIYTNPTANALQNGGYYHLSQPQFDGTFTLTAAQPVKGLTLRAIYSPHMMQVNTTLFNNTYPGYGASTTGAPIISGYTNNPNSVTKTRTTQSSQNVQALADYDLTLANDHHFHLLGGFQYQYYNYDYLSVSQGSLIGNLASLNARANPLVYPTASDNLQNNAFVSFFGRLNYDYKDKYLIEATLRNDQSSQLAPGYRSQYFPSVSAGWRLDKEDWFSKALPILDEFKLRGSWGRLGNAQLGQPYTNNYNYIALLANGAAYPFNNVSNPSVYQQLLPSPNLGWETIETTDGGIDFSLLKNRLTGSFDYFIKHNNNMLIQVPEPAQFGLASGYSNSASMKIWGWEANIGWRDKVGNVNYWVSANIGDNNNKVTQYNGSISVQPGVNTVIPGYPINSIWGYKAQGYFSSAAQVSAHAFQDTRTGPGDIIYQDVNGDGKINGGNNTLANHGDLVYLGNTSPRYNFGFNLGAQWKGFDLSAFFQGTGKRNMLIYSYSIVPYVQTWRSAWVVNTDYWTPTNQNAPFPRLYTGGTQNTVVSSHWVQNASYIRLKNLQLGYTLPKSLTDKVKLQAVRIFFTGQDLWEKNGMWYKYYDAENPNNASFNYPFFRSYAFGLNVTF